MNFKAIGCVLKNSFSENNFLENPDKKYSINLQYLNISKLWPLTWKTQYYDQAVLVLWPLGGMRSALYEGPRTLELQ